MGTVFIFHALSSFERSESVEKVLHKFLETYQLACPEDRFIWGPSTSSVVHSHVLLQSIPHTTDQPVHLLDQKSDEWIHSFLEADRYLFVTDENHVDLQASLIKLGSAIHGFFQDEQQIQNYFSRREVVHITTGDRYYIDPFQEPYMESKMDNALWRFLQLVGFTKYEAITIWNVADEEEAYISLYQAIEHAKTVALSFAWEGRVLERRFGFQWL
ncbi:FMN-dependent NADH-azoreductase [Croceifilum oryzae]|uniref:FMN-dependent NADH-azoreductase n=1 Tax=Croceifilum oryzae TaxID=1553429 RepID=A0AAJ1WR56_9BACL|nr:hypothetical protein [Croceifilum oryzae]MDQ0416200.1 FMN-dependent NADH-azoreductase [Croceifilum oryzae]